MNRKHDRPDLVCDAHEGCITCSDEGIPMRLVEASVDGIARCADERGQVTEVLTGLVEPIAPGTWVLVHAGTALVRLDPRAGRGTWGGAAG